MYVNLKSIDRKEISSLNYYETDSIKLKKDN